MLKKCIFLVQSKTNLLNICRKLEIASKQQRWDLFSAILIERRPIISPAFTDLEKRFQKYLQAVELEKSLKSDFEMEMETEKKVTKQNLEELGVILKQTTQDFIESCKDELAKFKPADIITEADNIGDLQSLERKLDNPLIMVLNQKIGEKCYFILPQAERLKGESLRQCAQRALEIKCRGYNIQIYGNAPFGYYKYKYPKKVKRTKNVAGAKIFIYYAKYISGELTTDKEFQWLEKSELDKILPSIYKKSVLPILFD